MSTIFATRPLLFAVLVILGTSVLALSAKEHKKGEPITRAENEGSSNIAQEERGKRAANIKIGIISKINFRQRLQNENGTTLQQRLQNVTGRALQQKLRNGTAKTLQQRPKKKKDIRDCQDVQKQKVKGWEKSGVFSIKPKGWKKIKVYCDMKTDGGGWTVFQRRFDGTENFYRKWAQYKSGFGNPTKNFGWVNENICNEKIHRISVQGKYKLRINLEDFDGNERYAEFRNFEVSDATDKYRLKIGSYIGNAGQSNFQLQNKMMFSTKDADNDGISRNCAKRYKSGWWYDKYCTAVPNINGVYGSKQNKRDYNNVWFGRWGGKGLEIRAMKSTSMMIRRQK